MFQDVLHTICQSSGQVLRIVIFKKNGVQAMVEYPFNARLVNNSFPYNIIFCMNPTILIHFYKFLLNISVEKENKFPHFRNPFSPHSLMLNNQNLNLLLSYFRSRKYASARVGSEFVAIRPSLISSEIPPQIIFFQ